MLGQIATFMDSLHLPYCDVVEKIPYRTLLLMQKDKLRAVYGEVSREVDDSAMLKFDNIG